MKTTITVIAMALLVQLAHAGKDLNEFKDVQKVKVTTHWGDLEVIGTPALETEDFSLEIRHTDSSNKPSFIESNLDKFVSIRRVGGQLFIEARDPVGFESIDMYLRVPSYIKVELELLRGGNILAENLSQGLEINSLNGSVEARDISGNALITAANGEIKASFKQLDAEKPISLVTMNGGVTVSLPENAQRDVKLRSRKNGYVMSDFELGTRENITNLNQAVYSKSPIRNSATINGGGALLYLSTENGPLAIRKYR